ncbi:MAG TPA: hypothetical protein VGB45_00535 [Abditibacterium sp.]|jgi:hypothetical protein
MTRILRFLGVAAGLFLATGCQQVRTISPEARKKMEARTAKNTVSTRLEARIQPEKPRAGEVSIWDIKIFSLKDKPDGAREEWKFFNQLPQTEESARSTEVLMNAWLISRDGSVFLPVRPSYKAYGSFVTDWTPPRAGLYTLYVEYQPARKNEILPVEMARWDFRVEAGKSSEKPLPDAANWSPRQNPAPITLRGESDGAPAGTLSFEGLPRKAGEKTVVSFKNLPDGASEIELAGMTAGGDFQHFRARGDARSFDVLFPKRGMVRLWVYFSLNGAPYVAPFNHWVS